MKNPRFFVQLDGSIRTIPNALGVIDSTVSAKDHILYHLYANFISGKSKTVFFSYRYSRRGGLEDYWNPNMDEDQLKDYETKFPAAEFERYFLNKWNSGNVKVFSKEMIEEIGLLGSDGYILNHETTLQILEERTKVGETIEDLDKNNVADNQKIRPILRQKHEFLSNRLQKIDNLYTLKDHYSNFTRMTNAKLNEIGDKFNTDWAIIAGLDMADPYSTKGKARSIVMAFAKGLPGSRNNPYMSDNLSPKYLYLLLTLAIAEKNSIDNIKDILEEIDSEYAGIDTLCSERYGVWDMGKWAEEKHITFEPVFPTYDRQREAFKEFYNAVKEGRLKAPEINIPGNKSRDIFREELGNFDHDPDSKWFGSSEKMEVRGIQDDCVFGGMWTTFGGRLLTAADFRPRMILDQSFGVFQETKNLIGNYK